jgi:hypothetical protein
MVDSSIGFHGTDPAVLPQPVHTPCQASYAIQVIDCIAKIAACRKNAARFSRNPQAIRPVFRMQADKRHQRVATPAQFKNHEFVVNIIYPSKEQHDAIPVLRLRRSMKNICRRWQQQSKIEALWALRCSNGTRLRHSSAARRIVRGRL